MTLCHWNNYYLLFLMEVCKYREICAVTKCVVPTGKIFWNCLGIIHHKLFKSHLTITAYIWIQQLQRVNKKLHEKRPVPVNCQNVILLDDNVRPHTERVTQKTIFQLQWFILPHPPYSPDLTPTYYQLFCSLQNFLNGKIFKSADQDRLSKSFSSTNQPHFTRMTFINCQKDRRRS